ncbi:MAG TPA: hypothetical protein VMH00_11595 [Candidatus Limnocylindrales bacterium]|nr:hypothetical protein [Candidatus Limnocylindrales bacterium]
MGKVNLGRVLLGGIVAGIVIDIWEGVMRGVILQARGAAVMAALGKRTDVSMKQLVAFNVYGLVIGIVAIWLYAAIRPRMGAGPKTAVVAGLAVWLTVFVLGAMPPVFSHLFPVDLAFITACGELVMMVIAGLIGGALYKEA